MNFLKLLLSTTGDTELIENSMSGYKITPASIRGGSYFAFWVWDFLVNDKQGFLGMPKFR